MGAVDGRPTPPAPKLPSPSPFFDPFLANLAHPRRHALSVLCPSPSILANPAMAAQLSRRILAILLAAPATASRSTSARASHGTVLARAAASAAADLRPSLSARAVSDRFWPFLAASAAADAAPGHSCRTGSPPGPVTFTATERSDGPDDSRSNQTPSPGARVSAPPAKASRVTETSFVANSSSPPPAPSFLAPTTPSGTMAPTPRAGFHHATRPDPPGFGRALRTSSASTTGSLTATSYAPT